MPEPSARPVRPRRRRVWLLLLLLAACGGAAAVDRAPWNAWRRWWPEDAEARPFAADRYHVVRRGSFPIAILAEGQLDAIKRYDLKFEGRGRQGLEIVKVLEDRTEVKAGDVVVAFSREKYEQEEDKFTLDLEEERKNLLLARQDLAMTRAANVSAVKSAADKVRTARETLEKYEDLDAPNQRRSLRQAVADAEAKLAAAEAAYEEARAALTAAETRDEETLAALEAKAEAAEKEEGKARDALEKARHDLRLFKQYDHPRKLRSLREETTKAALELQQALVKANGATIKARRQIQNHELRIRQLDLELVQLREDMAMLVLEAPVDGIVALGDPYRRHWQQPKEIKVGVSVRPQEVLATIPDLSSFMVKVDIPEEYRSRLEIGQTASLRSAAVPDLRMEGEVESVAPMATNIIRWDPNSPKVYATDIATDTADPRLMPGMSIRVEILVETVEDALYVPVEALYQREGATYCRVRTPTGRAERRVAVGRTSVHYAEILEGLRAGEAVLLHRSAEEGAAG